LRHVFEQIDPEWVSDCITGGLHCPLYCVTIHGGDQVIENGRFYRAPKWDLISAAQVLLHNKRLKIAARHPEAPTLLREMQNFKMKIDPVTDHDSYSAWWENVHDLVLALSMAAWFGERYREVELW
jgi:hypothetical protein